MGKLLDRFSGHPDGWEGLKKDAGINTGYSSSIPPSDEVRRHSLEQAGGSEGRVHSYDRYAGLGEKATGTTIDVQFVDPAEGEPVTVDPVKVDHITQPSQPIEIDPVVPPTHPE